MSKPNFEVSNLSLEPTDKLVVTPTSKIDNQLIQRNLKDYQVDIPDNPRFECSYWNGELSGSKKIESAYFTNFIASEFYERESYIEKGVDEIRGNIDCISKSQDGEFPSNVDFNDRGKFNDHIKMILNAYLEEDCSEYFGRIKKTTIESPLGDKGQLRLISVYRKDSETGISHLDLLFIDFYHLFIPSKHNGVSAEEMMKKNYEKNKNHSGCYKHLLFK